MVREIQIARERARQRCLTRAVGTFDDEDTRGGGACRAPSCRERQAVSYLAAGLSFAISTWILASFASSRAFFLACTSPLRDLMETRTEVARDCR